MVITPRKARTLALMAPMHVIGEPCLRWRQGTNTLKFQNYGEFKKATSSHIGLLHQRRHADRVESDEQIWHDGAAEDCHEAPAQRLLIVGDWCYSHDADRGRVVRYKEYHMVVNPEISQI